MGAALVLLIQFIQLRLVEDLKQKYAKRIRLLKAATVGYALILVISLAALVITSSPAKDAPFLFEGLYYASGTLGILSLALMFYNQSKLNKLNKEDESSAHVLDKISKEE